MLRPRCVVVDYLYICLFFFFRFSPSQSRSIKSRRCQPDVKNIIIVHGIPRTSITREESIENMTCNTDDDNYDRLDSETYWSVMWVRAYLYCREMDNCLCFFFSFGRTELDNKNCDPKSSQNHKLYVKTWRMCNVFSFFFIQVCCDVYMKRTQTNANGNRKTRNERTLTK